MKNLLSVFLIIIVSNNMFSQTLDDILAEETVNNATVVSGTFNGTRIMNGQSVETRQKGVLEFLIQHRFGRINSGGYELYGLDQSNIRFGLEYAVTNDFAIALGRSSFEKVYDGYLKYKIIKQKTGNKSTPLSAALFVSAVEKTLKDYDPLDKPSFSDRLTYTSQLLLARKFNSDFSIQITPTYIHYNTVSGSKDPNDFFALGIGTKVKISKHISINGEYYYSFNSFDLLTTKNSLAFGFDIETGGHTFQLIFTNSRAMVEKGFITETTGDFFKGDIHFGFNISRDFYLSKTKEEEKLY
ncbi:hypothetical protein BX611_0400 [Lutibacter oceani]|uniref:DUF5777 domain-containing protein n=1 Tax=Lutibacter oceani TaxID=1853311 RepID=A0A3D9RT44_9FLAO|nr:DUF5777 family beta-barrel protein [Lutibacter oceani]REE83120.1 hypothetical protein BX611_0400 [Lutibacter oceani]